MLQAVITARDSNRAKHNISNRLLVPELGEENKNSGKRIELFSDPGGRLMRRSSCMRDLSRRTSALFG
jgi:hypothetical protein